MPAQNDMPTLSQRAYRLQANILLLQNWQKELCDKVLQLPPIEKKWQRALATQILLSEHKWRYLQFAAGEIKKNQSAILAQINGITQNNPNVATLQTLIGRLLPQLKALRQLVQIQEKTLNSAIHTVSLTARTTHFFLQMPYFKLTESWMRTSEALTHHPSLQSVPILNVHLEENYLRGMSYLGGVLFLGMDIWASQKIGLTFSLLNAITHCLLLDVNALLKLSLRIGQDELFVLNNHHYLNLFMGLMVHISFYAFLTQASWENTFLFATTYLCALFCQQIATRLTLAFVHNPHWQKMALMLTRQMGYVGGTWLSWYGFTYMQSLGQEPTERVLLEDATLCQTYKTRCQQIALSQLNLNSAATLAEIRSRYRELALKHHPDKQTHAQVKSSSTSLTEFSLAYKRLRELFPLPPEQTTESPFP